MTENEKQEFEKYAFTYSVDEDEMSAILDGEWGEYELVPQKNKFFQIIKERMGSITFLAAKRYIESERCKVWRQKELYMTMIGKSDHSGVERLLNMLQTEIQTQYLRKEHFESRAGFLLTLWGIIVGLWLNYMETYQLHIKDSIDMWIICVLGGVSLFAICRTIEAKTFYHYFFESVDNNEHCAVENPILFKIRVLEGLTNVREMNEKLIKKKSYYFNLALWTMTCFAVFVILREII